MNDLPGGERDFFKLYGRINERNKIIHYLDSKSLMNLYTVGVAYAYKYRV